MNSRFGCICSHRAGCGKRRRRAPPGDRDGLRARLAPQHRAGAADGLDPIAKPARFAAGLSGQADPVERSPAAAAQHGAENERIHVSDHACILMLDSGEGAQRGAFREAGGDLHAPGRKPARDDAGGRRRDAKRCDQAQAGRVRGGGAAAGVEAGGAAAGVETGGAEAGAAVEAGDAEAVGGLSLRHSSASRPVTAST